MKNIFLPVGLGFYCILILFFSCDKKVGEPPKPPVIAVNGCDTVSYTHQIQKIISENCLSCHNGKGANSINPDYSTYEGIKSKILNGSLKKRVIDGNPSIMPQGGPQLPPEKLALIQCWIDNGGKQFNFCDTIRFSKLIGPILSFKCATSGCHNPGSSYGDFTSYSSIKQRVDNGKFKGYLFFSDPNSMPPAPATISKDTLAIIQCWLNGGAKND